MFYNIGLYLNVKLYRVTNNFNLIMIFIILLLTTLLNTNNMQV